MSSFSHVVDPRRPIREPAHQHDAPARPHGEHGRLHLGGGRLAVIRLDAV
jgi:hypothetical protein